MDVDSCRYYLASDDLIVNYGFNLMLFIAHFTQFYQIEPKEKKTTKDWKKLVL